MDNRIKDYRKMYNLSQLDLAKSLHVSDATVSSWENGRTEPNMEQVLALSKIFGCTIESLFGGSSVDFVAKGSDEVELLIEYRKADAQSRDMAKRVLSYSDSVIKEN